MSDDDRDTEKPRDPLGSLLRAWEVEPPGESLDARLREGFARRHGEGRLWSRLLRTSVRVPLPLLAALVVLCVVSSAAAVRRSLSGPREKPAASAPGTTAPRTASVLGGFEPILEPRLIVVDEEAK